MAVDPATRQKIVQSGVLCCFLLLQWRCAHQFMPLFLCRAVRQANDQPRTQEYRQRATRLVQMVSYHVVLLHDV